jgi:hypothetical protein
LLGVGRESATVRAHWFRQGLAIRLQFLPAFEVASNGFGRSNRLPAGSSQPWPGWAKAIAAAGSLRTRCQLRPRSRLSTTFLPVLAHTSVVPRMA